MATYNISAELYDNPLTEKEGDFTARPTVNTSMHNKELGEEIVKKRTEYRLETIINILDLGDQEKAIAIAQGISVIDGVGQYLVNIRGAFDSATDKFDPKRHSLGVSYNPGKILRKLLADTGVNVTKVATTGPVIGKVYDPMSDTTNDQLTPSQPIKIMGSNLKVLGDPAIAGVFFIKDADKTSTRSPLIVTNIPSELTVMVPPLAEGLYSVQVVTSYANGSKQTKEPRAANFPILLTVGEGGNDRPEEI